MENEFIKDTPCCICGIINLNVSINNKIYCRKHYMQVYKYHQIKRTRFDKNDFVIYETYAEMIIYNKDGQIKDKTKIDIKNIEKISKFKWCSSHNNRNQYVSTQINNKTTLLSSFLISPPKGFKVDYIDGDTLNNLESNLRIVTYQQDVFNTKLAKNNVSGFKGVSWESSCEKWRAQIVFNGKQIFLGRFDNIEEAKKARINAEIKYFGEYSSLNLGIQ